MVPRLDTSHLDSSVVRKIDSMYFVLLLIVHSTGLALGRIVLMWLNRLVCLNSSIYLNLS